MDRDETTRTIVYQRTSSPALPAPSGNRNVTLHSDSCKYVKTKAYRAVKQVLQDEGRVLVCGSPGSGKTYMAMMLQEEYRKMDYDVVYPRDIRDFNLHSCSHANLKLFLVLDDIFGRFTANTSEMAHCFQVLDEIEDYFRHVQNDGGKTSFKVLLNSRTDIYLLVEMKLDKYKHLFLRPICIINLSLGKETQLSKDERKNILQSHLQHVGISMSHEDIDSISELDFKTLGFPYICKLFVDRKSSINAVTFFQKPLEYLDVEISDIFNDKHNLSQTMKAAVLLLLVLTDGSFNLAHLTDPDGNTDRHFCKLYKAFRLLLTRESLPNELKKAATALIGTYLTCDEDVVTFSHPTIHDAVAYALGKMSQEFVLSHCTLHFIVDRVVVTKNRDDYKNVILIEEPYIKLLLQRLANEMVERQIALSLSHQALLQEDIFKQLVEELKMTGILDDVIHTRDVDSDGLSFLFWASYTGLWKSGFLDILGKPEFENDEYIEAYLSFCITGNEQAFRELIKNVGNLDGLIATATLSDITLGAKEKMLVVSKRHDRNQDHLVHIASANGHVVIVNMLIDMEIDINDEGGMGMTPLMYGSYFGHHDLVKMLLKRGANTKMKNDEDDNCLHLAVRGGFKDIVKLLHKTMDPNCRGRYDRTPLMYAAYDGHQELVKLLIKHGANLQPEQTKLNKNNSLHEACVNDRRDIVKLLLDTYKMDIEVRGERGRTPLMAASRGGNLNIFKFLISRKAAIETLDDAGNNCLHLASMIGNVEMVKYLLDEEIFGINCKNNKNQTPIMCCIVGNYLELFKFLLSKGTKVDNRDELNQTCIHYASMNGNLEMLQILESKGLATDSKGFKNRTPIMQACQFGHVNVFTYLKGEGTDLNSEDKNHANCLHLACIGKNAKIVQILLDMNIFLINKRDKHRSTPLQNAVQVDCPDIMDLLIDKAAEVNLKDSTLLQVAVKYGCGQSIEKLLQLGFPINIRTKRQKTPLMTACRNGHTKIVQQILNIMPSQINDIDDTGYTLLHFAASSNNTKILKFLISRGANIRQQSLRGYYALHSAASAGAERSVTFFLKRDMHVDARDNSQETPLMAAMSLTEDNTDVVKLLMESGADTDVVNTFGDTLLHAAGKFGAHVKTVQEILQAARLNINEKNNDGNTPIMVVAKHGKWHLFELLHSRGANLNISNENGETILHLACKSETINKTIIEKLIKNGLSPDATDNQGNIPESYITSEKKRRLVVDIFKGISKPIRTRTTRTSKASQKQTVLYQRR